MNLTRNQLIIIGTAALFIILIALVLTGVIPGLRTLTGPEDLPEVRLTVWGVFDDITVFRDIIDRYSQLRPNVRVEYRLMSAATYEQDLVNALAENRGPDVFMLHNTWLPKHVGKLFPLPEAALPISQYRDLYPGVVVQDFAPDNVIFAAPLYVDTLALLYNRDFFDRKGIALPPKTWTELESMVPTLREINQSTGEIVRAAAAIGGSAQSINREADLLSALFLQTNAQMTNQDFSEATFARRGGLAAFNYYLKFSNPTSPVYTWNDSLHYSVDNFSDGNTAILFNYAFQLPQIERKNPFLNIGIAALPQFNLDIPITTANYWGLAVSNKSQVPDYAWDFILFVARNEENASEYARLGNHPPALRTLLSNLVNDPELGVFARQALTARSWPQVDSTVVERSFSRMVQEVLTGQSTPEAALRKAEDEITELMRRRL